MSPTLLRNSGESFQHQIQSQIITSLKTRHGGRIDFLPGDPSGTISRPMQQTKVMLGGEHDLAR